MNNKALKVLVVCGGMSTEREISLKSGRAIYNALKNAGFANAELFDLTADNMKDIIEQKPDIAFLALHGKGGEDGCIQGVLELAGIPYTGPGVASSAACMDKIFTKKILSASGLPNAAFVSLDKTDCKNTDIAMAYLTKQVGFPMVLKSPCEGSSIGVVIVNKESELKAAIDEIFKYGDQLLAEQFLDGVELTLPIFGNEEITALPVIEITSENEFYDYNAKYTAGKCHHIIPARISKEEEDKVKELGIKAYKALNCQGLSRVDFIIDKIQGPMIIEINTLPGMTEMSLFPDAAREAGISFEQLVTKIVEIGLQTKRIL